MARPRLVYLGIAIVTLATLAFEIVTTRVLSVVTWYHLAFFVVSLAMLGMTAAALFVYLRPERFRNERAAAAIASNAFRFGLSLPASHEGFIPGAAPLRLPRLVGIKRARQAMFFDQPFACIPVSTTSRVARHIS